MEKNIFYDIVLVLIFVFNARLLWVLFLVHYKYDSSSYMDFGAFWKTWLFVFCSFVVIIINFDNFNENMLSIELRIKRIGKN
jgi:hypothetical protein